MLSLSPSPSTRLILSLSLGLVHSLSLRISLSLCLSLCLSLSPSPSLSLSLSLVRSLSLSPRLSPKLILRLSLGLVHSLSPNQGLILRLSLDLVHSLCLYLNLCLSFDNKFTFQVSTLLIEPIETISTSMAPIHNFLAASLANIPKINYSSYPMAKSGVNFLMPPTTLISISSPTSIALATTESKVQSKISQPSEQLSTALLVPNMHPHNTVMYGHRILNHPMELQHQIKLICQLSRL
jgi:hypothetical protein